MTASIRFDGSAAATISEHGIDALRRAPGAQSGKQLAIGSLDCDRLDRISVQHHRQVPRHRYYDCSKLKKTQASVVAERIRYLDFNSETETKPGLKASLQQEHRDLLNAADTAKNLGYARRSVAVHMLAKIFPKNRRDTALWIMAIGGFTINVLWVPYLIHIYRNFGKQLEKQQQQQKTPPSQ